MFRAGRSHALWAAAATASATGAGTWRPQEAAQAASGSAGGQKSQLVFLGTGSSTGCPQPWCAANISTNDDKAAGQCATSWAALLGDPANNPDYRNNPSVLVRAVDDDGKYTNFVIDVGKTFRESVLRWFPRLYPPVRSLDAVVLTHEHADAMLGLDDLRGVQDSRAPVPLPVFLSAVTMQRVRDAFGYLVPKPPQPGAVKRWVAQLDFREIKPFEPFHVGSLEVTPIPLVHGEDCICLGFAFGRRDRVVYLSDLSRVPPDTEKFLEQEMARPGGIALLVLDCLGNRPHNTHFGLSQSLELARKLKARQTLLVGMACDAFPTHHMMNAELHNRRSEIGSDVQFARDGQTVLLEL